MEHPQITREPGVTHCIRHPNTESNLRCGRCDDLICPRCMVTTPVGARCPDCASIGRPAILNTSSSELGRAITFAIAAAVAGSFGLSVVLRIVVSLPFNSVFFDIVVIAAGMAGIGYLVGEAVRYGSGKKLDRRLRYVAAGGILVTWLVLPAWLLMFKVSADFMFNIPGIIALIVAYYIAANRVRV